MEIIIDNDAIDTIHYHDVTGHVHVGQSMYQGIAATSRRYLYCIYTIIIYTICTILYGILHDQETKDQACVKYIYNIRDRWMQCGRDAMKEKQQ